MTVNNIQNNIMNVMINRTDKGEPINGSSWPRNTTKSVDTRKRDLVIRITNWLDDKDEPAYDVECYIAGVYDFNESKSFCLSSGKSAGECRLMAIEFAHRQVSKHTT